MSKATRRTVLGAALCLAACPAVGAEAMGIETSPSILRMRAIFARIVEIEQSDPDVDTHDGGEFDALLEEMDGIARRVWASPVVGYTDVLERALVAHHFWADGVGENGQHVFVARAGGDPNMSEPAVQYLVTAVLSLAEGGAHV